MRNLKAYFLVLILIAICGCQENNSKHKIAKHGYLFVPLNEVSNIVDFDHDNYVWGSNLNSIFIIDKIGNINTVFTRKKKRDRFFGGLSVVPFNNTQAWIVNLDEDQFSLPSEKSRKHSLYIADINGGIVKLFDSVGDLEITKIGFSPNKAVGYFFEKNIKNDVLDLYIFNHKGHKRKIDLPVHDNEEVEAVIINDDSTLWVLNKNNLEYPSQYSNRITFISANGEFREFNKIIADNIKNQIEMHRWGNVLNEGKSVALYSHQEKNGIYLVHSSGTSEHLLKGKMVESIVVSNDKQHFWVRYHNWGQEENVGYFDLKGNEQLIPVDLSKPQGRHYVTDIVPEKKSKNIWIRSPKYYLYYVNYDADVATVKRVKSEIEPNRIIPYDIGKAWLLSIDASTKGIQVIDAFSDSVKKYFSKYALDRWHGYKTLDDTNHIFITTNNNKTYLVSSSGDILNRKEPIFESSKLDSAISQNVKSRIWLNTEIGNYLLLHMQNFKIEYKINQKQNFANSHLEFSIEFPSNFKFNPNGAQLVLNIFDKNGKKVASNSIEIKNVNTKNIVPFGWYSINSVTWNTPYKIELMYKDQFGSKASMVLEKVTFNKPFWQQKGFTTTLFFIVTVVLIFSSQLFKASVPSLSKWFPMIFWGTNAFLGSFGKHLLPFISNYLDKELFLFYLIVIFIGSFSIGIVSPSILRTIANIAPFHWFAPVILSIPFFKRRYFSEYIIHLQRIIETERSDSSNEFYAQIPAKISNSKHSYIDESPVKSIISMLDDIEIAKAPHILIVGPGGIGKSALLREFIFQYIDHFKNKPSIPIPIYTNATGKEIKDIKDLVISELGRFLISKEFLDNELKTGNYLIVIDAISESGIPPKLIGNFVSSNNEFGVNSPVLISLRPNDNYEKELSMSSNLIEIVPQKLDDITIGLFEEAYLGKGKGLSKKLRDICRTEDGFYQPIFVRLAIITQKFEINDITELYEATVRVLIHGKIKDEIYDEVISVLSNLCMNTYGNNGAREIILNTENEKYIYLLENAGLLIPIDPKNPFGNIAKRYKFIHDSIQTYLAVLGYYKNNTISIDELFFNFSTKHYFTNDKANFLFENGSEIFQIGVFLYTKYGVDLKRIFEEEIKKWSEVYKVEYSIRDVINSTPYILRDKITSLESNNAIDVVIKSLDLCRNDLFLISEFFHNFSKIIFNASNRL